MAANLEGVRPASESSIEIAFEYAGRLCVERVRMKPSPANLKRAATQRTAIIDAIAAGTFDYDTMFPKRKLS